MQAWSGRTSFTRFRLNSRYCRAMSEPSGPTSWIALSERVRDWRRARPLSGVRSAILFFARSSEASSWHLSSPVRLVIARPLASIVERVARSASTRGLSVSRFSKTNLRTAASRLRSRKRGAAGGEEVSAASNGARRGDRQARPRRQRVRSAARSLFIGQMQTGTGNGGFHQHEWFRAIQNPAAPSARGSSRARHGIPYRA